MRIRNIDDLIDMLNLQKASLPTYQTEVGATNLDITNITDELIMLLEIKDYAAITDAKKKTVFQIKDEVFQGNPDEPVSPVPNFDQLNPSKPLIAGLKQRAEKRNERFKAADGYTREIGIALGIVKESQPIAPETVKPVAEVFEAAEGYLMSVVANNRGKSNMWEVQIRRKGEENWTTVKTASGKSVDVVISPTTPDIPEKIQVRIRLIKNNEPYGQLSDAVSATLNP